VTGVFFYYFKSVWFEQAAGEQLNKKKTSSGLVLASHDNKEIAIHAMHDYDSQHRIAIH
jgi:hypothetical protein